MVNRVFVAYVCDRYFSLSVTDSAASISFCLSEGYE